MIDTTPGSTDDKGDYDIEMLSATDYYPFGMTMPGRNFTSSAYRYGFQGQEKDDEIKGPGNSVNYKYRMHDPRLGRFFAVDPLTASYPQWSPYQFSGNQVISTVELEGLEPAEDLNATGTQSPSVGAFGALGNATGITDPSLAPSGSNNSVNVSASTHDGKFSVSAMEALNVFGSGVGEISISSDMDAVTGFWETRATTEVAGSFGVSPSVGAATLTRGSINIQKDIQASSLMDWANQSGLVRSASAQFVVNFTKFTGMDANTQEEIWNATGFGGGISAGFSGSSSVNHFEIGNFYYTSGNRLVLGLSTQDSIIRAVNDTTLQGRFEFLERQDISPDSAKVMMEEFQNGR